MLISKLVVLAGLQVTSSATTSTEQVCGDGDECFQRREAEDLAMLQTGHPQSLEILSTADMCQDSEFAGEFHKDDSTCGDNSPASICTLAQLAENYEPCWHVPFNCEAASRAKDINYHYFSQKYEGGYIQSTVLTPPSYVCITGTCVSTAGEDMKGAVTRECYTYDDLEPGQSLPIGKDGEVITSNELAEEYEAMSSSLRQLPQSLQEELRVPAAPASSWCSAMQKLSTFAASVLQENAQLREKLQNGRSAQASADEAGGVELKGLTLS
eukprot:Skav206534  [mRNA]  locus=scaffold504:124796:126239:+ [translate_table: standard]